jgi:hypothetical protein
VWSQHQDPLTLVREDLDAGRLTSFRFVLDSHELGELVRPIHGTVTDIVEAGFYIDNAASGPRLQLTNLNIRYLAIFVLHGVLQRQIIDCWVDELLLGRQQLDGVINLTLKNTWIGQLNCLRRQFSICSINKRRLAISPLSRREPAIWWGSHDRSQILPAAEGR